MVAELIRIESDRLKAEAELIDIDGKSGRVQMIHGISGLSHADAKAKWHRSKSRTDSLGNFTEMKRCEVIIDQLYATSRTLTTE
jgi:hypothetical protein